MKYKMQVAALGDPTLAEEVRQAKARLDATFGVLQRLIRSSATAAVVQQEEEDEQEQEQGGGDALLFDRGGGAGLTQELWYWAWLSVQVRGIHRSFAAQRWVCVGAVCVCVGAVGVCVGAVGVCGCGGCVWVRWVCV